MNVCMLIATWAAWKDYFDKDNFKSQVLPEFRSQSVALCRGLFEVFLGSESVVPDAKSQWAQGARNLLESERVQKDTRPGGFG